MSEPQHPDSSERADRLGKTRTWWHPLLARLLDYELATAYAVRDEVLVGKLPLRVDILLIEQLTRSGHGLLLCYTLQQIKQFRRLGEEFVMQHAETQYMTELEEELQTAVLETIPVEKRLRGMPPEERLRGLSPEEVLRRFTPEGFADGLSDEQADGLRKLLERRQGK
jgi:hypothetical protein